MYPWMDIAHSDEIQQEIIKNIALDGYSSFLVQFNKKSLRIQPWVRIEIRKNIVLDGYSSFLIQFNKKSLRIEPWLNIARFLLNSIRDL